MPAKSRITLFQLFFLSFAYVFSGLFLIREGSFLSLLIPLVPALVYCAIGFGFFAAVALAAVRLCAKTSFGVPYLTPFAPIDPEGLKDFIYMAPFWSMKRIPISIVGKELRRTSGKK